MEVTFEDLIGLTNPTDASVDFFFFSGCRVFRLFRLEQKLVVDR